jgi:hypothetical protein
LAQCEADIAAVLDVCPDTPALPPDGCALPLPLTAPPKAPAAPVD